MKPTWLEPFGWIPVWALWINGITAVASMLFLATQSLWIAVVAVLVVISTLFALVLAAPNRRR